MATTIYLVRHAAHDLLGKVLTGRMPGVPLSGEGRAQAEAMGRHFSKLEIDVVQSSPRQRAVETALPIALASRRRHEIAQAIDEIELGTWTGLGFEELRADPLWRDWNRARGQIRPPGGEMMAEVTARVMAHLERCQRDWPDGKLVLVSHADVIKAAILAVLRTPIESHDRLDIVPAAISTLLVGDWGARVEALNERVLP